MSPSINSLASRSSVMPSSTPERQELTMFGSNHKKKRIEELENIALTHSTDINQLKMKVDKMGEDLGNLRLDHKHWKDQVDRDWTRIVNWKKEIVAEQAAQESVILKIRPSIKTAEQTARVMIEKLQAEQAKNHDQLSVALQAVMHQGHRIQEMRQELREIRESRGKHETPEHRLVPYKKNDETVLYRPPPPEGGEWDY